MDRGEFQFQPHHPAKTEQVKLKPEMLDCDLAPDFPHQVPKGLQVDEVVNMGQHGMHMSLVKEEI
jgi:hypothetical protein